MYLIAEIGQAHEGSLGIAHSYIDALARTGVNAVKFQTHIAEAESSIFENFRTNFSYEDKTRFDYWKRMEFNLEEWIGLKSHCDDLGLEFISSPFSCAAVDLLEKVGVNKYKIGSGEISNRLMIDKIGSLNKDVILSSGLSSFNEIERAVNWLKLKGNNKVSILQCTTSYPTKPEEWGLNVIQDLKHKFKVPIGYSDHSGDINCGIAAYILGAEIFEFHCIFDKEMFGPDSRSSLNLKEIKRLKKSIDILNLALNNPIDKSLKGDVTLKKIFGKSLCVNKKLKSGDIICYEDLESKKPAEKGISAESYQDVIGKKLLIDLNKWDFINQKDLI